MNALAFPFLADGIPIMYSGAEHDFEGGKGAKGKKGWVTPDRVAIQVTTHTIENLCGKHIGTRRVTFTGLSAG